MAHGPGSRTTQFADSACQNTRAETYPYNTYTVRCQDHCPGKEWEVKREISMPEKRRVSGCKLGGESMPVIIPARMRQAYNSCFITDTQFHTILYCLVALALTLSQSAFLRIYSTVLSHNGPRTNCI